MKKNFKIGIVVVLALVVFSFFLFSSNETDEDVTANIVKDTNIVEDTNLELGNPDKVTVYFFWGDGCPHCASQKPYLEEWQNKYPEIEILEFETWKNPDNYEIFKEVATNYGIEARGVPTTFIGDRNWVGFSSSMAGDMEQYIQNCIENGCESPLN